MYTYSKYIIKTILPTLAILTIVLTSLVWITQILNMLSLIDKGIGLYSFLKLIILLLPYLLFMVMPIVSVLAVIHVYSRLQDERQLIVLRSAGLSNYAIAKPALLVAVYLTVISYYVSAHLMPISYNLLKLSLSGFRENYISSIIEARTFNQISKYITIYVSKKHSDRSMEGVILFDNKAPDNRTIFFAKNGEIITFDQQRTEFELTEGVRHSYDSSGNLTKLYFDSMVVDVVSDSTNFSNRSKTSLELFIHELLWPSDKVSIEKQSRLIIDGHSRLIWPLFNFIFVFLALSTFLNFSYSRKVNVKQYIYTFIPVIIASYFHFTLQKIAYKDLDYVFLCYANVFICIIFSILQSTRNKI